MSTHEADRQDAGRPPPVDEEGFLLDSDDWTPALAARIADAEGIPMTEQHWFVVRFVRDYFETNEKVPEARVLLKAIAAEFGSDAGTRRALYRLFPYGYGQQACKIAGMRKPRKLMLDV